jgi:glycosyltransferase involved in cell wall biosynthesis
MIEKHVPSATLKIAMGGRALLTPLTGIGQYAAHLAQEFVHRGHDVRLFYGTHWSASIAAGRTAEPSGPVGGPSARTLTAGMAKRFARKYLPGAYRFMPHVEQYRFSSGVRRHATPHVYHDPNFIPFRFRGPTVITAHDASWVRHPEYHPQHRLALLRANFPKALERADRVIVVSEFVRDELLACFSVAPEKLSVVYNGVSSRFKPYSTDATHEVLSRHGLVHGRYFAAVGTLEPRKNLETALAAHARLPASVRRAVPLVLIGVEGWLTDSLNEALGASLTDGTARKLGYVPDHDLPILTAGALALVYPSIYEGFGLPVLEAMAAGVPVLCSTARALQEVVGDAGLMCDPADVAGFTDAMQALIDDDALRERLITAGSARARRFSWRRTADETLAVYRQVLA